MSRRSRSPPPNGTVRSLGVTGLLVAAGLVAMAAWSGLRGGGGAAALNAFAIAAVVLFAFGFSSATGSLLGALPLLSFTAFGLALLSARWQSGGTRVVSYLLQVAVAVALTLLLVTGGRTAAKPGVAALAAGALALAGLLHHRWCRRNAPPEGSIAFALIGAGDRCAVALLTASLAGVFFLVRTGAFVVLSARLADARNAFGGAQSVIITVAAMALFALAVRASQHRIAQRGDSRDPGRRGEGLHLRPCGAAGDRPGRERLLVRPARGARLRGPRPLAASGSPREAAASPPRRCWRFSAPARRCPRWVRRPSRTWRSASSPPPSR